MIEPYQALGLVPTMRGIRRRDEIATNLEHLSHLIKAASWLSSLDLPVRLIAMPEGALQGFNDEVLDLDHEEFARECAIDIPGPETDYLGGLARQWNAFIMAQAKARHPEFPGRFFNVGFILSPEGEVILRHHKVVPLLPVEHSVTPHNVWDRWIELYGRNLDAFYPVADTEIGRLGFLMANEGSYPENARGLAMNGAEVVYRGPYPHPHVGNGLFEIQNRARALDNNMYLIACNVGTYYLHADSDIPIDTFGGGSAVIDYRGQIVGRHDYSGGSSWVAGTVDVEALRRFRAERAVGQLDQGPDHRAVPDHLRGAGLPEEPLPRPGAVPARRVPARGDRPADRADARAGHLGAARRGPGTAETGSPGHISRMSVTGPSLTRLTFMSAPNTPVCTRAPSSRSAAATASTSGSATGPGAAACQVGRRPFRVSAYSVNWLITSNGACTSEQDFSPCRMRSPHSLAASFAASASVSSCVTPTRTISPGSSIAPATCPFTDTLACVTRCTTALTRALYGALSRLGRRSDSLAGPPLARHWSSAVPAVVLWPGTSTGSMLLMLEIVSDPGGVLADDELLVAAAPVAVLVDRRAVVVHIYQPSGKPEYGSAAAEHEDGVVKDSG